MYFPFISRSAFRQASNLLRHQPLAVAGAELGFNFLGNALRDRLDPRTRLEMGL
jgi:ABC-type dipeptide/oligopeptide/nickel transport system permease subunit